MLKLKKLRFTEAWSRSAFQCGVGWDLIPDL